MIEALRKMSAAKAWRARQPKQVLRSDASLNLFQGSRWLALTDARDPQSLNLAQALRQNPRLTNSYLDQLRYDPLLQPSPENQDPLIWHSKSLGFNRLPKPELVRQVEDKRYDVCINLLSGQLEAFDFLASSLGGTLTISLSNRETLFYDLTLSIPAQTSPKGYLEHLFHYLDVLSPNHV